jgi:hypothetical protein
LRLGFAHHHHLPRFGAWPEVEKKGLRCGDGGEGAAAPRGGGGLVGWRRLDLLEEPTDSDNGCIFSSISRVQEAANHTSI